MKRFKAKTQWSTNDLIIDFSFVYKKWR
jgi:hypothetical protein